METIFNILNFCFLYVISLVKEIISVFQKGLTPQALTYFLFLGILWLWFAAKEIESLKKEIEKTNSRLENLEEKLENKIDYPTDYDLE